MTQRAPVWQVDPADPRAPPQEIWDALGRAARRAIIAALPSEVPRLAPPEGDRHRKPAWGAVAALDAYFRKAGRSAYVSSELAIYAPGAQMFAPDVLAVLDVPTHERDSWVVSHEGKGLDFVLEIHVKGDAKKDHEQNVERYASLGIPEYFLFDRRAGRLFGFRLPPEGGAYVPLVPRDGRFESHVLGLSVGTTPPGPDGTEPQLRFYAGTAVVPEPAELAERLEGMVGELIQERVAANHALEEAESARDRAELAREEAEAKQADTDRRLKEALAEIERLKRERR